MGVSYSTLQKRLVWFMALRTHKTTNPYQAEPWFILVGKLAGNPGAKCQMAAACGRFCLKPVLLISLSTVAVERMAGNSSPSARKMSKSTQNVESILVHVNRLSTKNWWHVCILRLICLHTSTSRKIFTAMIKHLGYPGAPLHLETLIQSEKGGKQTVKGNR